MHKLALSVITLWGWRRALVAVLAGALLAMAMAPFNFFPVIFVSFPVLVWLIDGIGDRGTPLRSQLGQAFLVAYLFGFGYFLAGLYWIGNAFLVDADIYAWMMPAAVVAMPLGLSLFAGVAGIAAKLLWSPGGSRLLALSAAWSGLEWVRGHLFTGFPWNTTGYALSLSDAWSQIAAFGGLYGASFLTVLAACAPALALGAGGTRWPSRWPLVAGPGLAVALLAGLWVAGSMRLATPAGTVGDVRLRIVQPNIAQAEKWKRENRSAIFARYLELSNKATSPETSGVADITHLIWPETALPMFLAEQRDALAAIAALLPDRVTLLTGSLRREVTAATQTATRSVSVYNSILQIDGTGAVRSAYDKFHLVPFGEYLPFEETLERFGFRRLVTVPLSFATGPGPRTMAVANAPKVSPLICYEIIFPAAVTDPRERPGWILNVTNDGWFGNSAGPYQHLQQARMRAIEEGLPVVRAANTGISAIIDPYGRLLRSLPLGSAGVIDGPLPEALPPTVYVRYRDRIFAILLALAAGLAMIVKIRLSRGGGKVASP